jgi:hypothetical protein
MEPFKNLSAQENKALLYLPVYISLLAANFENHLDEVEKISAIKFAHTKTLSNDSVLARFYKETDKIFVKNLKQIDKNLPKDKVGREAAIKKELVKLEKIVLKLGVKYKTALNQGMKSFKNNVSKAHHSVFIDFILPIPIPGLTDS